MTFVTFSDYICQKHVIVTTELLMKELGLSVWLTPREFLSSYLICSFKEDLALASNESNESNGSNEIVDLATSLVESFEACINSATPNLRKLHQNAEKFKRLFKKWKIDDAEGMIVDFMKTHYELDKMLETLNIGSTGEEIDVWEKEIRDYQYLIRGKLRQIGGSSAISRLDSYNGEYDTTSGTTSDTTSGDGREDDEMEPFRQQVKETAEKAFWDTFTEELKEDPPNLQRIPKLLEEIRDLLCALTPHNTRLCNETYEALDIALINQMVDHTVMGEKELVGYSNFILARIRMLEAPADDKETDELIALINKRINMIGKKVDEQEVETYSTVLPWLFKQIFDKLLHITKSVYDLKEM